MTVHELEDVRKELAQPMRDAFAHAVVQVADKNIEAFAIIVITTDEETYFGRGGDLPLTMLGALEYVKNAILSNVGEG